MTVGVFVGTISGFGMLAQIRAIHRDLRACVLLGKGTLHIIYMHLVK